jgi:cytochrome c oxidase cbb3-type subunit III
VSDSDRLLHHEYDGIQEYDNPLPGWWSGIFILTIVFAVVYYVWFHGGGPGVSERAAFERDWEQHVARRALADEGAAVGIDEVMLGAMARDPSAVARGREVFAQNCVACHLDDGRGQIGPNLTDDFQIHGATRLDLYATIRDGVANTGMLAWGPTLPPRDVAAVAAYVVTLRGRNVAGKPAEGAKVGRLP